MVFKIKSLSSVLVITSSPATRNFFDHATRSIADTTLIHSETEFEALDHLTRSPVICVVIDDKTPGLDLSLFCQKIRIMPDHRYTPILVISSQLKKGFMRKLLQAGATDFLRHPLNESDFLIRYEVSKKIVRTENKVAELSAQFTSVTTTPVSLTTRTIIDQRAVQLIKAAIKEKNAIAVFILEIDQFKKLSPIKKKKIGTLLLKDTEQALKKLLRQTDLLFNQKHGKFVMILPKTPYKTAKLLAENIKKFFQTHPFSIQGVKVPLTVSIGLATLSQMYKEKKPTFYLDRLLREAQTCLNEAKKIGNTLISAQGNG